MMRIDLLPSRYHQFRRLTKQVYWGLVGLAVVVALLGTVQLGLKARAAAYQRLSGTLAPSAGQYRTINARFSELQQAEKQLLERKSKAAPLLDRSASILPAVREFTKGLPTGAKLTALTVDAEGKLSVAGRARSYNDVSRFVKWVGGTLKYEQVALTGLKRVPDEGVEFRLTGVRPVGGAAE